MADISNSTNNTLIVGTAEDDSIENWADLVTVDAAAGNDTIYNYGHSVSIDTGIGNDYLYNENGSSVTIDGGDGNDRLGSGLGDSVTIDGGTGDDTIDNSGKYASIDGGAGNDSIVNSVGDSVTIDCGAGNDHIENYYGSSLTIDFGAGNDYIFNYYGDSVTIDGGAGNDNIYNDCGSSMTIDCGDGNDSIGDYGGSNVSINGGNGDDIIIRSYGYLGYSIIYAENVTINGGTGDDQITLRDYSGNDLIQYTEGDGNDTVWGYSDSNSLQINSASPWSSVVSGNNIVITVGDGSITLVDAASLYGGGGTESITPDPTPTPVTLPPDTSVTPVNPAAPTDVVFIIDNTGSMGDEINNVKTAIISFAKNLANSGAGYRLGLVEFGDLGDSNLNVYGFTDRDTFISWVDGISLTGGGDGPESGLEAITVATTMDFMPGSNKRFIVVSDADFHNLGEDGDGDPSTYLQTEAVQGLLAANAIKMDVVGTPESNCQTEWEPLANATGGKFYDINKLAGGEVLEEIADDILGRAHVNINLDIDSVPEGTTSGVFVVTPVLNAVGAVVPASSDATFKAAAEEGDYVVGYVVGEKAYMAVPDSPWRQIVTVPDNWIVSGTWQDDALNVTGSNAMVSGNLGKDNISINEDAFNTTLVDVSELQNGSDTLSFSKRVTPGTLRQNFTGTGVALYTTDLDGELDFVINLQGIAALDESLLNCEVSNAGKPNTIRELIYGEITVPIFNDTLEGRIMFAQWGYGFTPPEGNPLFVDPLATSADLAADFGSPTLDDIAPANFAVTQDDFTAQNFNADFAVKQAYKLSAASKSKFS